MKPRSAKNKGKKLQKEVQFALMESFPQLEDGDIRNAIMGESGTDLKLSPAAKKVIPYSIECKNQEKISIWSAIKQSEDNCEEGTSPVLIFRRNNSETYVTLKFTEFLKLITPKNP